MRDEIGLPEEVEDIWAFVTPGPLHLEQRDSDWYIVMEAECAWEEEHGLMLVWRNGATLTKAGGWNGHVTNANAYADPALESVVYKAVNSEFTTRL